MPRAPQRLLVAGPKHHTFATVSLLAVALAVRRVVHHRSVNAKNLKWRIIKAIANLAIFLSTSCAALRIAWSFLRFSPGPLKRGGPAPYTLAKLQGGVTHYRLRWGVGVGTETAGSTQAGTDVGNVGGAGGTTWGGAAAEEELPLVVLVHGFCAEHSDMDLIAEALLATGRVRVLQLDNVGRGYTECRGDRYAQVQARGRGRGRTHAMRAGSLGGCRKWASEWVGAVGGCRGRVPCARGCHSCCARPCILLFTPNGDHALYFIPMIIAIID